MATQASVVLPSTVLPTLSPPAPAGTPGLTSSEALLASQAANRLALLGPIEKKKEDYRADLAIRLICPDCRNPSPNLVEEYGSGDVLCGDCGK